MAIPRFIENSFIQKIVHKIFLYQIHISNVFHRKFNIGIRKFKKKLKIEKRIVSILDFFLKLILMKRFSLLEISFSIARKIATIATLNFGYFIKINI
ncbi:hypothetical protein BpHYR1_035347 [Brachionus plicatilis]|uniref:Uncharacterized protein n=1 Tax=Brachionus plicatilis TaxID=10195 RepID=A0A3M7SJI7_BRAPC|nr:hypothetical protein BpHYR1_035347 [Brachionus plicatilis]